MKVKVKKTGKLIDATYCGTGKWIHEEGNEKTVYDDEDISLEIDMDIKPLKEELSKRFREIFTESSLTLSAIFDEMAEVAIDVIQDYDIR